MDATQKFELLKRFFEEQGARNERLEYGFFTGIGSYIPSQLTPLNKGIETLVQEGFIETSKWFMDVGFGDLRVMLLMAVVYRVPSLGIEYCEPLVDISRRSEEGFRKMGLLDSVPLRFVRGDFTTDKSYNELGVRFEDIATFFNYFSNHELIAERISQRSPPGTVFILEGAADGRVYEQLPCYKGLRLVRTVVINESRRPENVDSCLHVYRKEAA